MSQAEAVVFDPCADLRRDVEILLARAGLSTRAGSAIDGYDPDPAAPPRLLLTSTFADRSGLALIRRVRALQLPTFVVCVDRQLHPDEGGDAFAAGADDVIRAPFTLRELGLRLRARLGGGFARAGDGAPVPEVMVDPAHRLCAAGTDETVQLTPAEAEIVTVLIRAGGTLVTRDALSREIDRCDWIYGDRKFDVHVTRIRKKLKAAFSGRYEVRTIRSEGYALRETAPVPRASETR